MPFVNGRLVNFVFAFSEVEVQLPVLKVLPTEESNVRELLNHDGADIAKAATTGLCILPFVAGLMKYAHIAISLLINPILITANALDGILIFAQPMCNVEITIVIYAQSEVKAPHSHFVLRSDVHALTTCHKSKRTFIPFRWPEVRP